MKNHVFKCKFVRNNCTNSHYFEIWKPIVKEKALTKILHMNHCKEAFN